MDEMKRPVRMHVGDGYRKVIRKVPEGLKTEYQNALVKFSNHLCVIDMNTLRLEGSRYSTG
jgi:hypothetical protein